MTRISHAFAVQTAAVTALVTIALVGLPALAETGTTTLPTVPAQKKYEASNDHYAQTIVSRFRKTGAASYYDNKSIETSAFDYQAYVGHTCYRPTEYDMKMCEQDFGPYNNLRTTLENGQLRAILKQYKLIADVEPATVAPAAQGGTSSSVPATIIEKAADEAKAVVAPSKQTPEEERAKLNSQRVAQLWAACQKKYADREDAKLCFQRNYRLIYRYEVTLEGSIN